MPFKKRKEAKQQHAKAIVDDRIKIEKNFDAAIMKATQLEDPAEKVIALTEIDKNIDAAIESEKASIAEGVKKAADNSEGAGFATMLTGYSGVVVYTAVVGAAIAAPVILIAIPVTLAGLVGNKLIAFKHADTVEKKLQAASATHIENLRGQKELVSTMADVVVENNVEAICKSPKHDQILALPGISDKFAAAAVKRVASIEEAPAADVEATPRQLKMITTGNKLK
jgi:hypothetical protein